MTLRKASNRRRLGRWIRLEGIITSGRGEGRRYVGIRWVQNQISKKIGFQPYAGTLNVKASPVNLVATIRKIASSRGIMLLPPGRKGCFGACLISRIDGRLEGAILVPSEGGYVDSLEIISPVMVKSALKVSHGDSVKLDVYIPPRRTELLVQAVILDLDGTLINTLDDFCLAVNKVLLDNGIKAVSRASLSSMLNEGLTLSQILRRVLEYTSINRGGRTMADLTKKVQLAYLEASKKGPTPINGALEAVHLLSEAGVTVGLATGSTMPREKLRELLVNTGLSASIKCIVSGVDVDRRKPFPDIIERCVEDLGVLKRRCLSVGDSEVDIRAGKAAGVLTAGVLTGMGRRRSLEAMKPNVLASDLLSLVRILFKDGILVPEPR